MDEEEIKGIKLTNKKVPGKMKDELDGNILLDFVWLRAKAYAFEKLMLFTSAEEERQIIEVKKLKGIQKCVVKKNLSFNC